MGRGASCTVAAWRDTGELERLAEELGIDVVGAAPRRALRGDRAAHPRAARARALRRHALHDGAAGGLLPSREAASAARARSSRRRSATTRRARARSRARGACRATRGATPTPSSASGSTSSAARLGGALPRARRREPARRPRGAPRAPGVGFYGKNTLLITRRHGSWVVLGTLVTDVEVEATPPLELDCGACRALHRRVPDRRARRAGRARLDALPLVLDAGAGADPGGRTAPSSARRSTAATSARTSARGTAASRSGAPATPLRTAPSRSSRSSTGSSAATTSCAALRPPLRAQERPALAPAERPRRARQRRRARARPAVRRYADGDDELLARARALGARHGSSRGARPRREAGCAFARGRRLALSARRARSRPPPAAPRARARPPRRGTARISPTSQSALPNAHVRERASRRSSGRAPRSSRQRATSLRVPDTCACGRRAAGAARSRPRLERPVEHRRGRASGRAGTCARRRACGPTCGRTSSAARARASTARRCARRRVVSPPSGTRSRRGAVRAIAVGERRDEIGLVGRRSRGSGVCASSNWPNVSSSLSRTRSSGVCASAAIIGPTNSSASRIARASSGVRRGGRRNVSPKSSLSTRTWSPSSSA